MSTKKTVISIVVFLIAAYIICILILAGAVLQAGKVIIEKHNQRFNISTY